MPTYPQITAGPTSRSSCATSSVTRCSTVRPPASEALAHPRTLAVIEPLLGEDCHVIANTAWWNPGGVEHLHGGGKWHIDAGPHVPRPADVPWDDRIPYPVFAIATHILLLDCPADCGPTGVLPGSHKSGQAPPRDRLDDPELSWNGVAPLWLEAEAGDVQVFVSDVWHRRMPTGPADDGRLFLQVHYGRRDLAQRIRPTADANHLSPEAAARAHRTSRPHPRRPPPAVLLRRLSEAKPVTERAPASRAPVGSGGASPQLQERLSEATWALDWASRPVRGRVCDACRRGAMKRWTLGALVVVAVLVGTVAGAGNAGAAPCPQTFEARTNVPRLLDTRNGTGLVAPMVLSAGCVLTFGVLGRGGVPARRD